MHETVRACRLKFIMPRQKHVERHFTASETVRDIVIGMSDGLTVPFALAAGLSGAVAASRIIVMAGLAEIAAGSIAMGLGGYLAAKGEADHYENEWRREHREVAEIPEEEKNEVRHVFRQYGLHDEEIAPIVERLAERPLDWVKFMMRFELGIEQPDPKRAVTSATTIAASYVVGGLIPLSPYMFGFYPQLAFRYSVIFTVVALFSFGYIKGKFSGVSPALSGLQTALIGGLAALGAYLIAKLVSLR